MTTAHLPEKTIDVRTIPPQMRHSIIFQSFTQLPAGKAFDLVNDHDPRPLHYQFQTQYEGAFDWDYLEQGPYVWRVRITKV